MKPNLLMTCFSTRVYDCTDSPDSHIVFVTVLLSVLGVSPILGCGVLTPLMTLTFDLLFTTIFRLFFSILQFV